MLGAMSLFVALLLAVTAFVDEPLRRRMERDLNERLKGYSVRIRALLRGRQDRPVRGRRR